jgi:hypothetical protein
VEETGEVVKCMRVEDGAFTSKNDGSGQAYYHRLSGDTAAKLATHVSRTVPKRKTLTYLEKEKLYLQSLCRLERLDALADELRVPVSTLRRLQAGWLSKEELLAAGTKCTAEGAYTFPMKDMWGALTGFRLRCNGFKYTLAGSTTGFFVPHNLPAGNILTVVEGPSDAAAGLAYGFNVIGRPNNNALCCTLAQLIERMAPVGVHIIIDNDPLASRARQATYEGAVKLRRMINLHCMVPVPVVVLQPRTCKDLREMLRQGASPQEELKQLEVE